MNASAVVTPLGAGSSEALASDARRENLMLAGLVAPALVLVTVVALVPILILLGLSFVDESGALTFANYLRLFEGQAYARVFATTFRISLLTTAICTLLAVPAAYILSRIEEKTANLLIIGVMVPLWTSVLVRTYAWMVILQRGGLVNHAGMALGLWDAPLKLTLNEIGVLVGTVHIMLPYMILPVYSAMRRIDPSMVLAAASMGASPARSFVTVFLPLAAPGIVAGALVTFVLCLGFYVVPEVLGGGKVVMIALQAAKDVQVFYNWGAAAALGVVLLVMTGALLAIARRLMPRKLGSASS
jgi:putative spermidine/putrescine transport system permease protein/spermidine/putrescine transport system permease protein